MTFVSYAQNFEDLVLWRALKHIDGGLYVDVGAQHPRIDSVSRAFYERGWRGIHIEPVRDFADLLRQDRPDETVLEVALGASDGTVTLHVFPATGLSTAVQAHARRHVAERGFTVEPRTVPMLTLKSALGALGDRAVHWLKIDVEGFEQQVLQGWDSSLLRPWVLVVEATVPNSTATDYARWDPLVTAAGYSLAYFDGLNRFYLADEHAQLRAAFGLPPNVFDDVQVSGEGSWPLCGLALRRERERGAAAAAALQSQAEASIAAMQRERDLASEARDSARAQLAALVGRQGVQQPQLTKLRADLARALTALALLRQQGAAELVTMAEQLAQGRSERDKLKAALAAQARHNEAAHARLAVLGEEAAQAARKTEQARAALAAADARTHEWWSVADRLVHEREALLASHSWRLTAPLRLGRALAQRAARLPGRLRRSGVRRCRALLRRTLGAGMRVALGNAAVTAAARRLLRRFPGLQHRLRNMAGRAGVLPALAGMPLPSPTPTQAAALTPRATRLLAQLEHALDARKS